MVDGYLNFDTKIMTRGFETGLSRLGGKMDTLKSKLKGIAATVGTLVGMKAMVSLGKQAIETAASVNAANSAMTQTFGALESAATEAMQRIADESGIVRTRLQGAGTQIFAFAKASGMSGASALNMMEDALRVAADSAAYYDRSLEDTTETLKSFLKGNFANDAALGISCTETTRNAAANRMFAKSYRELSEAQKQLVLLQMVKDANRLSGAEGQAAREADGWENVLGNLKETWKQLLAVIGQPALHLAISVVKMLTAALAELTEYAKAAVGALSELFGWEDTETAAVATNIETSVNEQSDLTEETKETSKAQKELVSIDEVHVLSSEETDTGSEPGGAEAVTVAPAIDKKKTEKTANKLTEKLQKLLEPIKLAWELDSPALIEQAKETAQNIKGVFKSIAKSIGKVWTNGTGLRTMRNLLRYATDFLGVIGDIAGAFQRAWDAGERGTAFIQSYADKWNSLLELIHVVTQSFRDAWNNGNGESILGHILDIFTGINNITANLRTNFAKAWSEGNTGERIFDGILKTVDSVLNTFDGIIADTVEWSKGVDFGPLLEGLASLSEALAPLADTIGAGLRGFWNDVCLPLGSWLIEKGIPGAITLVQRAVEDLNAALQALQPYLQWFVDELAKPVGGMLGATFEVLTDADLRPSEIFEGLGEEIYDGTFWDTWASGAKDIFDTTELSRNMEKFGEGVYDFFAGVGGWIADFERDLESAGEDFYDFFAGIGNWFDEAFSSIGNFFSGIGQFFSDFEGELEGVGESVADTVHSIGEWFGGLWGGIKKTFSGVGKWFSDKFTAAKNGVETSFADVGGWFSNRWDNITDAFSSADAWFRDTFDSARNKVNAAFATIGRWFADRWKDIKEALAKVKSWFAEKFQAAYDAVCSIFRSIGSWFGDRWRDIKDAFAKVKEWFAEKFQAAYDAVTGIFRSIGSWFSDRWQSIKDAFASVGTWFKTKFQDAYNSITSIFSGVGDFFDGIWQGIKDGVKSAVNFVIGGLNDMIEKVESGINAIVDGINSLLSFNLSLPDFLGGDVSFSVDIPHAELPRIPALATGTVVPANYGNFLAMLGDNKREPEVVSPLSTIKQALSEELAKHQTQTNAQGDIIVRLVCDGRTLAQVVQKYAIRNNRVTNGG